MKLKIFMVFLTLLFLFNLSFQTTLNINEINGVDYYFDLYEIDQTNHKILLKRFINKNL